MDASFVATLFLESRNASEFEEGLPPRLRLISSTETVFPSLHLNMKIHLVPKIAIGGP